MGIRRSYLKRYLETYFDLNIYYFTYSQSIKKERKKKERRRKTETFTRRIESKRCVKFHFIIQKKKVTHKNEVQVSFNRCDSINGDYENHFI